MCCDFLRPFETPECVNRILSSFIGSWNILLDVKDSWIDASSARCNCKYLQVIKSFL